MLQYLSFTQYHAVPLLPTPAPATAVVVSGVAQEGPLAEPDIAFTAQVQTGDVLTGLEVPQVSPSFAHMQFLASPEEPDSAPSSAAPPSDSKPQEHTAVPIPPAGVPEAAPAVSGTTAVAEATATATAVATAAAAGGTSDSNPRAKDSGVASAMSTLASVAPGSKVLLQLERPLVKVMSDSFCARCYPW